MLEEVNGIVIKNVRYGEADRILTVFTKENGKITVVAKGAMSRRRNIALQTQTFSLSSFILYPGKDTYTIKSADFIKTFDGISRDMERLAFASYLCELVDIFYEDRMEEEITFYLILYYLDLLQSQSLNELPFIILSFMIKLLGIGGILPDFDACSNCGTTDSGVWYLDFDTGETKCLNCTDHTEKAYRLSGSQMNAVRLYRGIDVRRIGSEDIRVITDGECAGLVKMFNSYISYTLMKKTRSFSLVKSMMQI